MQPLCLMLSTVTDVYLAESLVATDQDTPFTPSNHLHPTLPCLITPTTPTGTLASSTNFTLSYFSTFARWLKGRRKRYSKALLHSLLFLWCSGNQQAATNNFDHRRTLTHLGVNQVMLTTYYLERLRLVPDQNNPACAVVLASSSYFGEPEISEFSTGLICVGSMHSLKDAL